MSECVGDNKEVYGNAVIYQCLTQTLINNWARISSPKRETFVIVPVMAAMLVMGWTLLRGCMSGNMLPQINGVFFILEAILGYAKYFHQ